MPNEHWMLFIVNWIFYFGHSNINEFTVCKFTLSILPAALVLLILLMIYGKKTSFYIIPSPIWLRYIAVIISLIAALYFMWNYKSSGVRNPNMVLGIIYGHIELGIRDYWFFTCRKYRRMAGGLMLNCISLAFICIKRYTALRPERIDVKLL